MRLSIVVVVHNMKREVFRCVQSLARDYQHAVLNLDYEVLLVDNGSDKPPRQEEFSQFDVPVRVLHVDQPTASPAAAVNLGLDAALGECVCIMIDGAHVLTPGVLRWSLSAFESFSNPLVAVRYFYLGPGDQPESVLRGYSREIEDQLFAEISWPSDGYRLFEIGSALRGPSESVTWLNRMFESNCLTLRRDLAIALGGMDERFNLIGGGFVNLDFFKRACDRADTQLVELIGEGSFHQIHGGTTTNAESGKRQERLNRFRSQYVELRGDDTLTTSTPIHYLGHLPTEDAKIHRRPSGRLAARCLP
ncbi:MAG: glycosyltransferase [Pseudomonadota bacterium]